MNGLPSPSPVNQKPQPSVDVDEVDCPMVMSKMSPNQILPKPRYDIAQSQIAEELREVEMLNAVVQQTLNNSNPKRTKKKSVSFCDQVILVATADEEEEDSFIPNPILERVLRNAASNSNDAERSVSAAQFSQQQQQHILRLQSEPMSRNVQNNLSNEVKNEAQLQQPDIQRLLKPHGHEIQEQKINKLVCPRMYIIH